MKYTTGDKTYKTQVRNYSFSKKEALDAISGMADLIKKLPEKTVFRCLIVAKHPDKDEMHTRLF